MFFTNIDYRNCIEIVGDITILPKSISEIDLRLENEKNSVPSELAPLLALSSFFTACIRASAPNKFRKSILSHEVSRNELRIPSFPQPSFAQEMLAGIGLKKTCVFQKKKNYLSHLLNRPLRLSCPTCRCTTIHCRRHLQVRFLRKINLRNRF